MAFDPLPVLYLGTMAALLSAVFAVVHVVAFSESPPTDAEWRADAASLTGEVRAAAEGDPWEGDDSRRLAALASRIQGHLRAAPKSVDRGIERELFELSLDCRAVGFERTAGRGPPAPEELDDLDAVAKSAAALERRLTVDPTPESGGGPDDAGR
jgi:acetylornithine deacetylase/succinyl-diaminopimelate desuccinylase-like protein